MKQNREAGVGAKKLSLTEEGIRNREDWVKAGYRMPGFDRRALCERTAKAPRWVHFGAGNIFRAFPACIAQRLLEEGVSDCGLIVAEGFDIEIIDKIYRPHDNLSVAVTFKSEGTVEKTVVGSVTEALCLDRGRKEDFTRLTEIFAQPSLQLASFTITEKGYALYDEKGALLPQVAQDLEKGPAEAQSYLGRVAALLYSRYQAGGMPLSLVSLDNCARNGDRLREAVCTYAEGWVQQGVAEAGFEAYVTDSRRVAFPWTMIDKITPRPDQAVKVLLEQDGLGGMDAITTARHTYIAPFVNAEECEYLIVEDAFPNARPALEKGGPVFTDRETVQKAERMKVSTCLNPLHTALAVFGCLLGYDRISEEMRDATLYKLVERIGYEAGLPVVTDPKVLVPEEFLETVLKVRLPNPFLPDTPQRIATDTSQKLSVRFGETLKAWRARPDWRVEKVEPILLIFAGWLRYLTGIDDMGRAFCVSPDPLAERLAPYLESLKIGEAVDRERVRPVLENRQIFGADLYELGVADRTLELLEQLLEDVGAVRRTLEKVVGK